MAGRDVLAELGFVAALLQMGVERISPGTDVGDEHIAADDWAAHIFVTQTNAATASLAGAEDAWIRP